MGTNILSDDDEITVRRIGAGGASGFPKVTPAFVIATPARARNEDYVVLTLAEAERVCRAILAELAEE